MSANWNRFCKYLISDAELGFTLDVSRVRFEESDLASLLPRMEQALQAMQQLEAGAIANPDEKRMVGHYWLRSPELAPQPEITAEIQQTQAEITRFADRIHEAQISSPDGGFQYLLVIGIGGSALGPQFVAQALGSPYDAMLPFFIDNTDPDGIDRILDELEGQLAQTLVLVVSKSGGTPETRNGMLEVQKAYRDAGLTFATHAVAITQEGSKLDQIAKDCTYGEEQRGEHALPPVAVQHTREQHDAGDGRQPLRHAAHAVCTGLAGSRRLERSSGPD